ncbi:MAG: biopolymer transporter ExbD [Candidatus Sumerlaeaceae bacterium]|nr:biopolymer transporter ExbD [Candidatus Sumerlaeaceae bacterium]
MRRHRRDLQLMTQINLTSMLDVAFVLLIAFMIVAPSLKYGLDLELPTIKEGAPQLKGSQQQLYTIVVPKPAEGGTQDFFMNDSPSQLKEIEDRLKLQKTKGEKVAVEIQADRAVPYETFVQVVAAVRRAGVEAVGLPVDAQNVLPPSSSPAKDKVTEPVPPASKVSSLPAPAAPRK